MSYFCLFSAREQLSFDDDLVIRLSAEKQALLMERRKEHEKLHGALMSVAEATGFPMPEFPQSQVEDDEVAGISVWYPLGLILSHPPSLNDSFVSIGMEAQELIMEIVVHSMTRNPAAFMKTFLIYYRLFHSPRLDSHPSRLKS